MKGRSLPGALGSQGLEGLWEEGLCPRGHPPVGSWVQVAGPAHTKPELGVGLALAHPSQGAKRTPPTSGVEVGPWVCGWGLGWGLRPGALAVGRAGPPQPPALCSVSRSRGSLLGGSG